jgi:hypothetical protein
MSVPAPIWHRSFRFTYSAIQCSGPLTQRPLHLSGITRACSPPKAMSVMSINLARRISWRSRLTPHREPDYRCKVVRTKKPEESLISAGEQLLFTSSSRCVCSTGHRFGQIGPTIDRGSLSLYARCEHRAELIQRDLTTKTFAFVARPCE